MRRMLGRGSFGTVRSVIDKNTGLEWAAKIMPKNMDGKDPARILDRIREEVSLLCRSQLSFANMLYNCDPAYLHTAFTQDFWGFVFLLVQMSEGKRIFDLLGRAELILLSTDMKVGIQVDILKRLQKRPETLRLHEVIEVCLQILSLIRLGGEHLSLLNLTVLCQFEWCKNRK